MWKIVFFKPLIVFEEDMMKVNNKDHNSLYDAIRLSRQAMWEEQNEVSNFSRPPTNSRLDLQNDEEEYLVEEALEVLATYPCLQSSLDSYVNLIKQYIIGQDNAVEDVTFVVNLNQYMNFCEEVSGIYQGKRLVQLMVGDTGTGKTSLVQCIGPIFDVPVYIANITATTSSGYVGENVEDMLIGLYEKADCDIARAERGILYIDEIDKKVATSSPNERDVAGKSVQQELLKIMEASELRLNLGKRGRANGAETIRFSTENLTVILGGAFVGLSDIRKKRLHKKRIGFSQSEQEEDVDTEYTHEDLINYGFIPEFVGRIDIITEFRRLTAKDIVDIIYSPNSAMQQKISLLDTLHVENVEVDPLLWEKIASMVENHAMGVRALNQLILKLFKPILFIALQHHQRGTCKIDEYGNFTLKYENDSKIYSGCGLNLKEDDSSELV